MNSDDPLDYLLSEHERKVCDQVMRERQFECQGMNFLVLPVEGENVVVFAEEALMPAWRTAVVEEIMRRLDAETRSSR